MTREKQRIKEERINDLILNREKRKDQNRTELQGDSVDKKEEQNDKKRTPEQKKSIQQNNIERVLIRKEQNRR